MMDNELNEKLTSRLMADSKLNLTDPDFDGIVLGQVMNEFEKKKKRKLIISNILLFIGIEFTLLAFVLLTILYFPGNNNLSILINSGLQYLSKIGEFVIRYDYLFFSFIVVGILELITSNRTRELIELL